jgi:hypothetical protein
MSFGYSFSDFVLLTQLAYSTIQNAREACGVHSALVREVNSLHIVLTRLESEAARPESILSGDGGGEGSRDERKEKRKELRGLVKNCESVLKVLANILTKYNALSHKKRSAKKLWQRVKFGNGEMQDLSKIRSELTSYTHAITLFLNLLGLRSQGKVERYMESHGQELREVKTSLNWVTAKLQAREGTAPPGEKSILSSYVGDDKEVWKMFRRELIKDGVSSRILDKHKTTIKKYVMELGERGVLDDVIPNQPVPDVLVSVVDGSAIAELTERDCSYGTGFHGKDIEADIKNNAIAPPVENSQRTPTASRAQTQGGSDTEAESQEGISSESEASIDDSEDQESSSSQLDKDPPASINKFTSSGPSDNQTPIASEQNRVESQKFHNAATHPKKKGNPISDSTNLDKGYTPKRSEPIITISSPPAELLSEEYSKRSREPSPKKSYTPIISEPIAPPGYATIKGHAQRSRSRVCKTPRPSNRDIKLSRAEARLKIQLAQLDSRNVHLGPA